MGLEVASEKNLVLSERTSERSATDRKAGV